MVSVLVSASLKVCCILIISPRFIKTLHVSALAISAKIDPIDIIIGIGISRSPQVYTGIGISITKNPHTCIGIGKTKDTNYTISVSA